MATCSSSAFRCGRSRGRSRNRRWRRHDRRRKRCPSMVRKAISRQRAHQLKKIVEGICSNCFRRPIGIYSEKCDLCARKNSRLVGARPWQPGGKGRPPKHWREVTRDLQLPPKHLPSGAVNGAWLKFVRLRAGLLQIEAAARMGMAFSALSAIETGRTRSTPRHVLAWYERLDKAHARAKSRIGGRKPASSGGAMRWTLVPAARS